MGAALDAFRDCFAPNAKRYEELEADLKDAHDRIKATREVIAQTAARLKEAVARNDALERDSLAGRLATLLDTLVAQEKVYTMARSLYDKFRQHDEQESQRKLVERCEGYAKILNDQTGVMPTGAQSHTAIQAVMDAHGSLTAATTLPFSLMQPFDDVGRSQPTGIDIDALLARASAAQTSSVRSTPPESVAAAPPTPDLQAECDRERERDDDPLLGLLAAQD